MADNIERKPAPGRDSVEVLGATFEAGKPAIKEEAPWRFKLNSREDKLRYLQTAERYWFAKEGFGSERRKNPA